MDIADVAKGCGWCMTIKISDNMDLGPDIFMLMAPTEPDLAREAASAVGIARNMVENHVQIIMQQCNIFRMNQLRLPQLCRCFGQM